MLLLDDRALLPVQIHKGIPEWQQRWQHHAEGDGDEPGQDFGTGVEIEKDGHEGASVDADGGGNEPGLDWQDRVATWYEAGHIRSKFSALACRVRDTDRDSQQMGGEGSEGWSEGWKGGESGHGKGGVSGLGDGECDE